MVFKKNPFLVDFALQLTLEKQPKEPFRKGRPAGLAGQAEVMPWVGWWTCPPPWDPRALPGHGGRESPTPPSGLGRAGRDGLMPHKAAAAVIAPF